MPHNHGVSGAHARKRNVALIVAGIILCALALGAGVVFTTHLSEYLTVEERWADDSLLSPEAHRFGVSIVQHAAMRRMTLFGPLTAGLGIAGVVLFLRGLRKK